MSTPLFIQEPVAARARELASGAGSIADLLSAVDEPTLIEEIRCFFGLYDNGSGGILLPNSGTGGNVILWAVPPTGVQQPVYSLAVPAGGEAGADMLYVEDKAVNLILPVGWALRVSQNVAGASHGVVYVSGGILR